MRLSLTTTILLFTLLKADEIKQTSAPGNGTFADSLPGSQVVCIPTSWYDIVWFYFANYVMHALSVRSLPGENLFASIVFKLACLMIPFTGIRRGLCLIARASNLVRNDLQAAARANALCMVVRGEKWKPTNEAEVPGCKIEKVERVPPLPDGSDSGTTIVEIDDKFTEKEKQVQLEAPDTIQGKDEEGPILNVKPALTSSTTASIEDATGTVSIKITDCYQPPPAHKFLERVYRIFIETYKFGRSSLSKSIRLDPEYVKVHGLCNMSSGYELAYVPPDIKVHCRGTPQERPNIFQAIRNRDIHNGMKSITSQTRLASSQNAPRILFSLSQTVTGAWSLYRAQGAQIDRFGYTAYGLTVLPYIIVSVINFAGSLLTKEYDMVYMIHSSIMDEMVSRGGSVDGVIGSLEPQEQDLAEPTSPSIGAEIRGQELLIPEGSTVQFRMAPNANPTTVSTANTSDDPDPEQSSLTYRDPSMSTTWSPALTLAPLPDPNGVPADMLPIVRRWYMINEPKLKAWLRHKCKNEPYPTPQLPTGLTIVHVPCHGTMIRIPPPIYEEFLHVLTIALLIAAVAVPWVTISLLTGWKKQQSHSNHRSFVINWLVCGMVLGYGAGSVERLSGNATVLKGLLIVFVSYGSYCISGFVTVAQEMIELGKCTAL